MKKIPIVESPMVFTKDKEWFEQQKSQTHCIGQIRLLPEDAVLVTMPIIMEVKTKIDPKLIKPSRIIPI